MAGKDQFLYTGKELEAMSFARNYNNWILEFIEPYLGKVVAEVGAGIGNFSEILLKTPLEALVAFEPSKNLFPLLSEKLKSEKRATPFNGFLNAQDCKKQFDSVIYVNVLEHIENERVELVNSHYCLRARGHLLLFVPALEALWSNLDLAVGHYRRYNKSCLVSLVEDAGFRIIEARYFDVLGIIPWYINCVLMGRGVDSQGVALYDKCVVPLMKKMEKFLTPPVGKNILLIAQKN